MENREPLNEENEFETPMYWSYEKLVEYGFVKVKVYELPAEEGLAEEDENLTLTHYVVMETTEGNVIGIPSDANGWTSEDVANEFRGGWADVDEEVSRGCGSFVSETSK
jgi:hypothetical protein